ncbi:hypothetical protein C4K35_4110 [Pseudomonas chlororaphis subsp. piscium]|uniref:type III secretion system translocon subunit SctE n=1 Tax=Pseudomonas chlororaphis TaxID=587753 RepID=UPI000F55CBEB|nr:type III secretion system translocon subunit SctE [Pseudomonas chlororaphis]AZC51689.1 hypothetical protein C4K35_4110 [Pseudomonas chlororaphis subsp. piscium]
MDFSALYSRISPEGLARQAGRENYTSAASAAANTKVYQRVADTVLVGLQGVSYSDPSQSGSVAAPGRPRLAEPKLRVEPGKKDAQDTFTLLMATLIGLLGEVNMESLKSRMSILKSAAKAAAEGNKALSEKYQNAVAEMEAAVASASESEEKLSAAKAKVERAQKDLDAAEAALGQTEAGTPEHDKALAARDLAQSKLADAQLQQTQARTEHQSAMTIAGTAGKKAEEVASEVEKAGFAGKPELEGMKTQLNAASTMILLMMRFAALMGESAENKIEMEQELFLSMQAARQEFMEKKSEEYLEEVKKAEAASKAMGCIGKIIGAVLMVVSVVAAAFTGGASLALAAVGVALMGADMLSKELTGFSFMEEAMKPLMENILAPMIEAIGKGITGLLKGVGIDAKTAEMAGMIMGAIIGALAMVAVLAVVVLVGKSAASRVADTMGKMLGKMVNKMVPDMLKQATQAVSKGFTSAMTKARTSIGLKSDANSLGMYSARISAGVAATEAGSVTAQSALGVKSGIHQRDAAEALSGLKFAMLISESLKVWLSDMVQFFDQSMNAVHVNIKKALDVQSSVESAGLSMARNI